MSKEGLRSKSINMLILFSMIIGTVGDLKTKLEGPEQIFYVKASLTPAGALTLTTNARVLSSTLATALGQVVRCSMCFQHW